MAAWDAAQYLKFAQERTQPAMDLLNRVPLEKVHRALDVGCGPGNSTAVLARRYPDAAIEGIDKDAAMIEEARRAHPDLHFALCDAAHELSVLPDDYDLVFSNACIQWIPDHPALLEELLGRLRPGGVLAVQVPINEREPIHQVIAHLVSSPVWASRLAGARLFHTLTPGAYYDCLTAQGALCDLWETTYYHRLASHDDLLEWYRGTGLRPYLDRLNRGEQQQFEREIMTALKKVYSLQPDGTLLFRFPRLFFLAVTSS